ncbi:MAG: hypothetical protein RLZ56_1246, partial [Bacteroidota bacterium]|jgi:F0F1-type ATP synthase assembly protein I
MKKFIQVASFIHVIAFGFLFKKIIQTDLGLIIFFIVSMVLLFLNLYKFQEKKKAE